MRRLMISAAHKSSGKTMLSLGLARALRDRGAVVQPMKKGPDYIDPLWLGAAAGRPCYNLDFNTQDGAAMAALLARVEIGSTLTLIEGTKGLYDGVAADGSTSNAAVARLIGAPVVLVIDCQGMTRGIAPLLLGYMAFPEAPHLAGVILNKVGGARHEAKLRAAVEQFTDLPVLGAVPMHDALKVAERHLGLIPATEQAAADRLIDGIAAVVADHVDLDAVMAAGAPAPPAPPAPVLRPQGPPVRIGLAQDAAFAFYYPDDLDALRAGGAEIVPIDTLRDRTLPPGLDGLVIGGGFPETQMEALEANGSLRAALHAALVAGLPCYAECGGLMYLSRRLRWGERSATMIGLIPADTVMHPRPRGRGYVRLRATTSPVPWRAEVPGDGILRAHEFHYSTLEGLTTDGTAFAWEVLRGDGVDGAHDGLVIGNTVASYTHLRGCWVAPFLDFVRHCAAAKAI